MLEMVFAELGPWNWMVLGFALLALEIVVPGFFLLWIGVAALLTERVALAAGGTTVVVLSGGNVDLGVVPGLIRRAETRAGRRAILFARISDRPGGLARLLNVVGEQRANLLEVEHVREGLDLHVRETGVQLVLEVRDRQHTDAVLAAAKDAGYDLRVVSD